MRNVPDDWNAFWYTCSEHDVRYHASEGCPICELSEEEQKEWIENRDSSIEEEAELRYYDEHCQDWEPMDHPEW